jgi:DNA replication and repair protein RecF
VVAIRAAWAQRAAPRFSGELERLGEREPVRLRYHGRPVLAERSAWEPALAAALAADRAQGTTTIGPHRDDLVLESGGRPLRSVGSTGEQRTATVAPKLLELATLAEAGETGPALVLDDVFAELDGERQARLARRLGETPAGQMFVAAPRRDELPRR